MKSLTQSKITQSKITQIIKTILKPKYIKASEDHSSYLIRINSQFHSLVKDINSYSVDITNERIKSRSTSKLINKLFDEIFDDEESKDTLNKSKIDLLFNDNTIRENEITELIKLQSKLAKELEGTYDNKTRKNEGGLLNSLNTFDYKIISAKLTDKQIISKMKTHYANLLLETSNTLTNQIEEYKPTNIQIGCSKHDINFILSFENSLYNTDRSFTIDTIIAGGIVQTIHNRTLTKLHKTVIC